MNNQAKAGIVPINGKDYKTVAYRVNEFREIHPDWIIKTKIVSADDAVIMKASILDAEGKLKATGYAEEVRGSTNINKTSALENAETSAIGRALAALGYAGTEYASADEVANAITQQNEKTHVEYMSLVMDNIGTVQAIKNGIINENYSAAAEAWFELDDEIKGKLWKAPTKGGCFTTKERDIMKSTEFREAHFGETA